ncbi:hypothetical protein BDV38DRAFT_274089 [Aspergillus pseudotamarii]|uniref:Protein-tyrosine phosphatase-like protein n=1 Tax=Aspergillus pseudotamarii TaxID=132259 RepID=A0A5N6SJB8_ASPPS|nr:uncharacterized protein BDV38DRAFT_274089 [Aspergillus pseudotamarii]KAE8133771.1 hypothetical protein BDV38DRAFT_274089 [Aspergillus pseudotamarii]
MSAMTGPRSPTSPWPQEPPNLQITGHPTSAAIFSLCDSHQSPLNSSLSPRNAVPERSGPNYFSISVESSSTPRKTGDTLSYTQSSIPSPKPHLLPTKAVLDDFANHIGTGSTVDERSVSAIYRRSLSRALPKKDSIPDRSDTSSNATSENGRAVAVERCAELLESSPNDVILLDVRPYAHFAKGSIKGSLNLCIPTTLLKRPSFDTQKLANTFTNHVDKMNFARWKYCRYIIVYDAGTSDMKDAGPLANVLKKFTTEGWNGDGLILRGGFDSFSNRFPTLLQQKSSPAKPSKKPTSMHIDLPSVAPIAGGCALPDSSRPTIPFFGNIRQHMDLLGGVGQIPLQLPESLTESLRQSLPPWLREATDPADQGRGVSEKFLELEKKELERMKQALTYDKPSDTSAAGVFPAKFRVAGIEKGTKNRYNDIYPFDHSRVKLQDVPPGGCDYVNANFMKAEYGNKCYIATQAPVPDTFIDFWRVIWEQDVRLVVSLTAEFERGQIKCHPYWESGKYGPLQVNNFSQKYLDIDSPDSQQVDSSFRTNEDSGKPYIIQLFRVLQKRASQQLYGAQFTASCTQFHFGSLVLDVKASSLAPSEHQIFALVYKGHEDIQLFRTENGQLQLKACLKPHRLQPGVVEVLRTAFDADDGLYVLQRFTPTTEESPDSGHPFIKQAFKSYIKGQVYLIRYSLQSRHDPVRVCTFPDHAEYEPLALAAAHRDTFAISWQHSHESEEYEVVLYNAQSASSAHSLPSVIDWTKQRQNDDIHPHARLANPRFNCKKGPVIELAFNDRSTQILYYHRAQTLYGSFQNIKRINMTSFPVQPTLYQNSSLVQFSGSLRLLFSIAIPFYGTHATRVEENGHSRCQWKYLAFGVATHRTEDWTVACLLKSEAFCSSEHCGHVLNLERGRRFLNWTVVARLWGFQDSNNSLGCKVATSKHGTRIAVANWNVLYIWALQPSALIEQNANGYYPSLLQSPGSAMVELRPLVIPLDAVCFELRFTDAEDELLAITDRGLMYWNLGPLGRGQRITEELPA